MNECDKLVIRIFLAMMAAMLIVIGAKYAPEAVKKILGPWFDDDLAA